MKILYGVANPSGKLPFSIAQNVKDYPYFNPYPEKITFEYYHDYTLFDKKIYPPQYETGRTCKNSSLNKWDH